MKGDKGEKRKQELLKIAYRLIISKGYEETSIDEIIAEARIAKVTFYYHFKSKEEMLEGLINMMIMEQTERAKQILSAPLPISQKTVAIITSFRPNRDETTIQDALNMKDNIVMHEKINRRVIDEAVPILSQVVAEGIEQGILECDNINERVRMTLIISSDMFDHREFTSADIDVFIDTVEKILGAKKYFRFHSSAYRVIWRLLWKKEVIIFARHLKKVFGSGESEQVVYSDFDIDIYKGDFTVIMGASGAGKSTLMYSLSGMDNPNAGLRSAVRK